MNIYVSSQLLPGLDSVSFCLCIVEKEEDVSQESWSSLVSTISFQGDMQTAQIKFSYIMGMLAPI